MRVLLALIPALLAAPASGATLVVRTEGLQSTDGMVRVAVCNRSFDEAGCPVGGLRRPTAPIEEFVFEDIPPGGYAIASYHDLNGNGRLDTIPPGIPREPYGFSNDVGRMAPPSFKRALVQIGEGRTTIVIHVRRLLGGT
jgi:uncharacterized protein (DUF2141 family)